MCTSEQSDSESPGMRLCVMGFLWIGDQKSSDREGNAQENEVSLNGRGKPSRPSLDDLGAVMCQSKERQKAGELGPIPHVK